MSFEIYGGYRIEGEINIAGSKNAALPILISSLLSKNPLHLSNIADLKDIEITCQILKNLGVKIVSSSNSSSQNILSLDASSINNYLVEDKLVNSMRASVLVIGVMLARFGEIKIALPGGCAIGERPIDLHIKAFKKMGAKIEIHHGYIIAKTNKLIGTSIDFKKVSVTGTCNVIMAATLASGITIIKNAAKEPEVVDLIKLLQKRGVEISGSGTSELKIKGVKELKEVSYNIITDRIESATYLVASGVTGGNLVAHGARFQDLEAFLKMLNMSGFQTKCYDNAIEIKALKSNQLKPTHITTAPFPGFATDLQALYSIIHCLSSGVSTIKETIFENRFCYLKELNKMGAKSEVKGSKAYITGVKSLYGAELVAPDLRAGAGLVLAGLCADGKTTISQTHFIKRGYEQLVEKLSLLGANIKQVSKNKLN